MALTRPLGTRALVTGATAGIGAEFARQLAAAGLDLVLVARNAERLGELAAELRAAHDVEVEVLPADLLKPAGLKAVEARVAASLDRIDVLVNNAGFGLAKPFDENPVDAELDLLALLVEVPLRLTHAALSHMLPAGAGVIVNIASVAGFTPRGSYGAAKAWLLSFSRWANVAYRHRGVTVTAVAPGFVRTEFHQRMGVAMSVVPEVLWLKAQQLVRIALKDVARGKSVSIPTVRYKAIVAVSRLVPDRLAEPIARLGRR